MNGIDISVDARDGSPASTRIVLKSGSIAIHLFRRHSCDDTTLSAGYHIKFGLCLDD